MGYIQGEDRRQPALFPECIDDYITEENPVRVIDAFVESLDIEKLGFKKSVPAETGRPPYNPKDLIKLYIYGYMNRIRSSRRLEREAQRNFEVVWLLNRLKPDFKTIADFYKDNREAMRNVFRQFSLLCNEWGLYGKELVAVDGTKVRANNSKRRNITKKKVDRQLKYIDEKINHYLAELQQNDATDANEKSLSAEEIKQCIESLYKRKEIYEGYNAAFAEGGVNEISLTDPDARLMGVSNKGIDVCYNVQAVVDSKHSLVVDSEVINNPNDHGQLSVMTEKAMEIEHVDKIKSVADKGYYITKDIVECESKGIEVYVPKQNISNSTGEKDYYADKFTYDRDEDVYLCPAGQKLFPSRIRKYGKSTARTYKNNRACRVCPHKDKCTTSSSGRVINRVLEQDVLDGVDKRLKDNKDIYNMRQRMVEHPFGSIKRNFGFNHFLTKGLVSVNTEAALVFLAYNMTRVINILGTKEIMRRLAID